MDKQTDTIIELHGITKVFEDGLFWDPPAVEKRQHCG